MNKQKLIDIDKAVESKRGLIGKGNESADVVLWDGNEFYLVSTQYAKTAYAMGEGDVICTIEEYAQRARELGWVNGYKWGVEYPTSGKKPNLPDDVFIEAKSQWYQWSNRFRLGDIVFNGRLHSSLAFRVVDERFKPKAETVSEFFEKNEPTVYGKTKDGQPDSSWYERGELPPVGSVCLALYANREYQECEILKHRTNSEGMKVAAVMDIKTFHVFWSGDFRPLKSDREKFIDACIASISEFKSANQVFGELYDKDFRAPEDK